MSTENQISFDDNRYINRSKTQFENKRSISAGIVIFLVKNGLVKNEKQAEILLISIIVIVLIISFWLFKNSIGIQEAKMDPSLLN